MDVLSDTKAEIVRRGRRFKDAAESYAMPYVRFSRVINGFDNAPPDFHSRMRQILAAWDTEDGRRGEASDATA